MYIYILKNTANDKQYVGQSVNYPLHPTYGRVIRHLGLNAPRCRAIHNAIKKHGASVFEVEILHYPYCNQITLNSLEQAFIKNLNTLTPNGYNLKSGGSQNGKHSEESKQLMSENSKGKPGHNKGKKLSAEYRRNISKNHGMRGRDPWNKGKKGVYSKETIAKMSAARKGKTSWNKGKSWSKEMKRKLSENNGMKGKKHTSETKSKMSASHKKRNRSKSNPNQLTLF